MRKILFILFLFLTVSLSGQIRSGVVAIRHKSSGGGSSLLTGIVAYYKLDEASGNAADQVGSATLVPNGTTAHTTSGILGGYRGFNGTSDYLGQVDGTFELQAMSISAWVKTTQIPTSTVAIVDNYMWTVNGWGVWLGGAWDNTGKLVFHLLNTDYYVAADGGIAINTGNWVHIVCTWSGTTIYTYVNGVQDYTGSFSGTITYDADNRFKLGCMFNGDGANFLNGSIDEVGVWNRALTPTEVATLYNSGTGKTYPF